MTIDTAEIFGSDQIGIHVACVGQYVFHPARVERMADSFQIEFSEYLESLE